MSINKKSSTRDKNKNKKKFPQNNLMTITDSRTHSSSTAIIQNEFMGSGGGFNYLAPGGVFTLQHQIGSEPQRERESGTGSFLSKIILMSSVGQTPRSTMEADGLRDTHTLTHTSSFCI